MSTIRIGTDERELRDADPQWITQEIQGRRKDGLRVCVVVQIRTADISMTLATPGCGGTGGAGRPPNRHEREVFELWEELGLDELRFEPGKVVAFVKRVIRLL